MNNVRNLRLQETAQGVYLIRDIQTKQVVSSDAYMQ
jgi:hypothetical protein